MIVQNKVILSKVSFATTEVDKSRVCVKHILLFIFQKYVWRRMYEEDNYLESSCNILEEIMKNSRMKNMDML